MARESLVGKTIGKYKIVQHLGHGGMAEVYKGYQESLDRHVAIKLMHSFLSSEEDFMNRFQREARAMAKLSHTNIVSVYDYDIEEETSYIVMEFVDGGTLKDKIDQLAQVGKRMALSDAIRVVLEMCDALAYAHSYGMVHRDIKPANIMISDKGSAMLTDFGIAKMMSGPSYTATGALIGTPAYMAPEQGMGEAGDGRSDLYALAVLFFQLVTGQLPFDGESLMSVVFKHINDPIPRPTLYNPQLPKAIEAIIIKGMAKNPDDRYESVHEMSRTLRVALTQEATSLALELPSELLRDHPTPTPLKTQVLPRQSGHEDTAYFAPSELTGGNFDQTAMFDLATPETQLQQGAASSHTVVGSGAGVAEKKSERTFNSSWMLGIVIAIFLLGGAGAFWGKIMGSSAITPTVVPIVVLPTETATITLTPSKTPDAVGTVVAAAAHTQTAIAATATAAVTATPTPSKTPTATATSTATPNLTATFIANCTYDVELVNAYSYSDPRFLSAPVNAEFPIHWVIKNIGSCAWKDGDRFEFVHVDGNKFGQDEPLVFDLDELIDVDAEWQLDARFVAPAQWDTFDANWQLTRNGDAVGQPLSFKLRTYVPVTATPKSSQPTAVATTPSGGPTSAPPGAVDFNTFYGSCEYVGDQWRCLMTVTPFGGGGGPYTVWVFDSEPAARYYPAGNISHFIQARRCFPWVHEIKVQDDASGLSLTKNIFVDPNSVIPGGCQQN